jgi:hypothetical protein
MSGITSEQIVARGKEAHEVQSAWTWTSKSNFLSDFGSDLDFEFHLGSDFGSD